MFPALVARSKTKMVSMRAQKLSGKPGAVQRDAKGRIYVEFFQIEKFTNQSKGIVQINSSNDPMLNPQITT